MHCIFWWKSFCYGWIRCSRVDDHEFHLNELAPGSFVRVGCEDTCPFETRWGE